jgi:hypothetical protein
MTKKPCLSLFAVFFIALLASSLFSGCNMPGAAASLATLNVTQAYQTVEARLTSALEQTPAGTSTLEAEQTTDPAADPSPETGLTVTPAANSLNNTTVTATSQPTSDICDQAAAGYPKIDITIEDDTEMAPGEAFTKIWRVENAGTCTWTADYSVVFFSGEIMGATSSQPLNGTVAANQSIDISVNMVAPSLPGTYQGNWKLRNVDGVLFGIGPGGESPFWVRIKVVTEATPTPTLILSLTPTTEVQAGGSASLALNDSLDLDTLLVNGGGPDLRYRTTLIDPRHQLVPLIGATMSIFGTTQPSLSDCQAASLATLPILLDEMPVGTYFCHRTDLGLPGWTRFDGYNSDTGAITLMILTWKMP